MMPMSLLEAQSLTAQDARGQPLVKRVNRINSIQLMIFRVALVNVTPRFTERVHIIKRLDEEMIVGINKFLVVGGRSTVTVLM